MTNLQTDPENQDYAIEHGATRNFEAQRLVDEQEKKEQEKREEEESNPMKVLVTFMFLSLFLFMFIMFITK